MLIWTILFAASLRAADLPAFKSGPHRVSLLELYSSEGCSSCPPADEWLATLAGAKGLWTDFIPVAFQVDYWDRLGWKDALSSPEFTRRQEKYAKSWGNGRVYTPGVVLNGKEFRAWGEAPPAPLKAEVGVVAVETESPLLFRLRFSPNGAPAKSYVAHAALLGFGFKSRVTAGENEGKTLRHDFAAVDYQEVPLDKNGQARVRLRKKPGLSAARYGAAFWITAEDDPAPVQAAGGYLN